MTEKGLRAKAQAQRERDELADRFEETLDEIHAEMCGVRDGIARTRMIDNAILAERDPRAVEQNGRLCSHAIET